MNITCPQCRFERDIPEDRLPGVSAVATCPQCGHRFRVFKSGMTSQIPPDPVQSVIPVIAPDNDDPLPPGAVIPTHAIDPDPPQGEERKKDITEEKEYRQVAVAAYERQADAHSQSADAAEGEEPPFALENPWEHPDREGYLAAFYQTIVRVMFAAPRFFAGLKPETPQRRALFFYLIVSLVQILIERFWGDVLSSTLAPSATGDPQLQKLLEMLTPQTNLMMALLLRTALVTLELFVAAGLYFFVFKLIVPTRAHYHLIFQVLAYSAAPALLCVVPVAGSVAGFIWGIACSFVGCRYALRLSWRQTTLGLVPIYALGLPFILHLVQSLQAMTG